MITTYKIDMSNADEILQKHGLAPGGRIQKMLTNEIIKISDPYVPFATGILKNTAMMSHDGTSIFYNAPYARYLWYGKLMVDPITKKGAFFKEGYGFWSRPGVTKELTDRPLQYQGAPQRGSKWVEIAWEKNGNQILSNLERLVNKK